jgi:hypothetical protein
MRDLDASVAGQHASRPVSEGTVSPSIQALRSTTMEFGAPRAALRLTRPTRHRRACWRLASALQAPGWTVATAIDPAPEEETA